MQRLWCLVVLLAVASATVLATESPDDYISKEGKKMKIKV
jgi:hypothetical protein